MIQSIKNFFKSLYSFFLPLNTRTKKIRVGVLVLVIAFVVFRLSSNPSTEEVAVTLPPVVFVGTVADISATDGASFVGTVRAVNEAQIQSEIGGRVTSVLVKPNDTVYPGQILASLENASEQASLLQAQGAYEASLANAAQSEVSRGDAENTLRVAQNNVLSTYRDAYSTVNTVTLNTLDVFFREPTSQMTPGVRIDSFGNTQLLNDTRAAFNTTLATWKKSVDTLAVTDDLDVALQNARAYVQPALTMTDIFITATAKAEDIDMLSGQPVTSYTSGLNTARSTLNSTLSKISDAETTLANARENLRRAEIGSTQNTDVSLANAQLKQSLGVLRSAQANYEKTIFRSPIAGTVNSMRVRTGDFITAFTQVAEIANNGTLQISIYVGEADLPRFTPGATVTINGSATGTITSIAPAVDSVTQKTEVIVATKSDTLTNGSTVTVQLTGTDTGSVAQNAPILVPITSVKFTATNGSMFVVENGKLVAKEVTVGSVSGSLIVIESGIDRSTEFVLDARGLSEGQAVEAVTK